MPISAAISSCAQSVRDTSPLVHCITNYVTVEGCADALLAIGASPIMSDEPQDVEDIVSLCDALVINIGTLNERSIKAMKIAGARAASLGRPIVLDPVGAGASALRTRVAADLLDTLPVALVRGNMSEVKALAGASAATRGVDAGAGDIVADMDAARCAADIACDFAARAQCALAVTGPIDIVADATRAYAVGNGHPLQGRITGAGCMLSAMCGAYAARAAEDALDAAVAAVVHMGVAGERAAARMDAACGTGSFRAYLMDALFLLEGDELGRACRVEAIR